MSVISTQKKAINELKKVITTFVHGHQKTRVIPLAIPTGWGKTRIALRAVLNRQKAPPSVIIIWPQTQSHIPEIWRRPANWCKNPGASRDSNCKKYETLEIKPIDPSKPGPKAKRHACGSAHDKNIAGTLYSVNNNFQKGINARRWPVRGPIIFIIDEWHSKRLLEEYNSKEDGPEDFWRRKLLGQDTTRKLFVLLVSATPIGSTEQMDNLHDDMEVDNFKGDIKDGLDKFNALAGVGNQRHKYNLYKLYPKLIRQEARKLERVQSKHSGIAKQSRSEWIDEYIKLARKAYGNCSRTTNPPSLVYALESLLTAGATKAIVHKHFHSLKKYFKIGFDRQHETLKLRTIKKLLMKHANKKFVVFCHYKAVAHALTDYLQRNKIDAYYLENAVQSEKFKKFNSKDGKTRVLVVTDRYSQGVSLHESQAWLVHFELSWNPIRIIQRYGRVWRIDGSSKRKLLTKPVSFYVPHSYSADEEILNRLKRRWTVLEELSKSGEANFVNLAPISFKIALGIRCSPNISE